MSSHGMTLEAPTGFADRVRKAVIWRWGSQALSQFITWATTILIVRMLDPHDYGLFAMTQVVLAALTVFNGYSFATSLIQSKEVDERRIGQVFGMLIVSSVMLAGLQLMIAPLAAEYYEQPMVADMLRVQALAFLTTPFIALPSSLLARELNFRSQAWVNLLCCGAGSAVALALAWHGYGVWALVWAPIAIFTVRAIGLTVAHGGLVKPIFDFRGSRDVVGFGTVLMVCQILWVIQSNADIFLAGRVFTPHHLGLYSEALLFALIFSGRFLPPLNEVAFPAYAELKNAGKPIGPAFLSGVRMIMLIAAPFLIGLSLVAAPLVQTFFGDKWLEMIPIVAGLAVVMPATALQIVCSPATNALGRPSIYLTTSIAGAIIMPACFFFGAAQGPLGLVAAWHVAAPLLLAVTLAVTLPAIQVKLIDLARALLPIAVGCAAMAAAVIPFETLVAGVPAFPRLFLLAGLGAAVYGGTLYLLWPRLLLDAWAMLRKRRASAPAPGDQTTTTPDGAAA